MYLDKAIEHQYEMAKVLAIKKELENEIAKNQTIIDSLNDTIIKHIHAINLPLNSKMLRAAFHQQNEKKKSDRPMYEFVKNEVIDRFFKGNKEAKLLSIRQVGLDEYAYNFEFKFKNINFEIQYPCVEKINKENVSYAGYGTYDLLFEEKKSCWTLLKSSYDEDEIADKIEEFCK